MNYQTIFVYCPIFSDDFTTFLNNPIFMNISRYP